MRKRVAVSTIALNEEKHAERWALSARDADILMVADTGSTDKTKEILQDLGVIVNSINVVPFRFDVARNTGLALLPVDVDYVITLDMDEVLSEGWRDAIENVYNGADQIKYMYHWSDSISFYGDRCFKRSMFHWKFPIHEVLEYDYQHNPTGTIANFSINHLPDSDKSRDGYLGLLKQAVYEFPNDERIAHYYARELYFKGKWAEARVEFMRHLNFAKWSAERAESYRYIGIMDAFPEKWILKAIAEAPERREAWHDLILYYKKIGLPVNTLVDRVKKIEYRDYIYMSNGKLWDNAYLDSLRDGNWND